MTGRCWRRSRRLCPPLLCLSCWAVMWNIIANRSAVEQVWHDVDFDCHASFNYLFIIINQFSGLIWKRFICFRIFSFGSDLETSTNILYKYHDILYWPLISTKSVFSLQIWFSERILKYFERGVYVIFDLLL